MDNSDIIPSAAVDCTDHMISTDADQVYRSSCIDCICMQSVYAQKSYIMAPKCNGLSDVEQFMYLVKLLIYIQSNFF